MRTVVVRIEKDEVAGIEVLDGDIYATVKEYAKRGIDTWNPTTSDFLVLRDAYTVELPVPIPRDVLPHIERFSPKRVGDRAEVTIPIFEIIYGNEWIGDNMVSDRAIALFPYVTDKHTEEIVKSILMSLREGREGDEEGDVE